MEHQQAAAHLQESWNTVHPEKRAIFRGFYEELQNAHSSASHSVSRFMLRETVLYSTLKAIQQENSQQSGEFEMEVQEQPATIRPLPDTVVQRDGVIHLHQAEMNSFERQVEQTQDSIKNRHPVNFPTPTRTGIGSREILLINSPAGIDTVSVQAVSLGSRMIPLPEQDIRKKGQSSPYRKREVTPCEPLKQGWRFPHSPSLSLSPRVTGDALRNNPARVTFPIPKAGGDLSREDAEKDYQLLESTKEGTSHRQHVSPRKERSRKD